MSGVKSMRCSSLKPCGSNGAGLVGIGWGVENKKGLVEAFLVEGFID
jgi:hypothetical protein